MPAVPRARLGIAFKTDLRDHRASIMIVSLYDSYPADGPFYTRISNSVISAARDPAIRQQEIALRRTARCCKAATTESQGSDLEGCSQSTILGLHLAPFQGSVSRSSLTPGSAALARGYCLARLRRRFAPQNARLPQSAWPKDFYRTPAPGERKSFVRSRECECE